MEKGKLTAIIKSPLNSNFDEQYRVLTIAEGESFTVGIKEYEDAKKEIQNRIDETKNEINTIDPNLESEKERLFLQAQERYREGGKWIEPKKVNGKIVSKAQETYDANIKDEKRRASSLKDLKKAQLKAIENELSILETIFNSVVWAWNLAHNRSSKPSGRLKFGKGQRERTIIMDKLSSGGGFSWIEPFWDDKKPTGSIKNGLYYHSIPQEPDAIIAEWYGVNESENSVKIDQPVAPGSKVQLHIYTKDLYGQNIGVELKANGKTLKANTYSPIIYSKPAKDKESEKKRPNYDTYESKDIFLTEVEIYDYSDPSSIQPPAVAIKGSLTDTKDDFSDGSLTSLPNVQKAILNIYIDPIWSFGVPEIIIKPTIHFLGKNKELNAELKINGHKNPEIRIPDTGNMPVFVDNVETDFRAFHHCRYEKITAKFEEDGQPKEIPIFNSKEVVDAENSLIFPFVVGCDEAKREFEIIVEEAKTDECNFADTETSHKNHVINTDAIEARIIKGEGKYSGRWRLAETDDYLSGGEKKTEKSNDENDDNKITASNITNKFKFLNNGSAIELQKSFRILEEKTPFEFDKIPDQQVKMKIGYDYTFGGSVSPLVGLCYTFFPNSDYVAQKYPVKIDTCAYQKNLNINIYPDTKWTIQLGFNYDKEKFNQVRTKYHEKWKLQGLEAEEEKNRLQAKVEGTEENLKKLAEQKKRANRNDKGDIQGKIDRQRKKGSNYDSRIDQQQEVINKSGRKTSKRGQLFKAFDLMEPDDALEHGLVDCELGIIAEFDRPFGALDLTSGYSEIIDFIKKIADIKEKVDNIISGKDQQSTKSTPKENPDRTKKLKTKLDEKKSRGTKKSNWNFEFIPPSIGLSVGWYAERPKDIDKPVMGTMIEGIIDLNPLFGFEITYDVYQLLYKIKHPAVLAVVATLDILDEVLEDNFDINLDFIITTEASGTLKGTINTAEGSNYTDRLMKDEDDTPAKFGGSFKFVLKGFVQGNTTVETFIFGTYKLGGEVEASLEAGITMEFVTKANEEMMFLEPEIKVDSFVLKGRAKGYIVKKRRGDKTNSGGIEGETSGDIILTDAYEWEVKNWRVPLIKFK